jgi:predicted phosphodiesterase
MGIKTDLAKQYREKHGLETPTLALARIMYKENVEVFRDVDAARWSLRYIEGKVGSKQKADIKDKKFVVKGERPKNPYKLPDSEETVFKPYFIKGVKKLAVFSDIHVPYHSISAITAALDYTKDCDALLIDGDLIDFYGLSRFMKDPRKRSVAHELEATNDLLDVLQSRFKKIYYKLGNHDIRFDHYLMQKAPELLGIKAIELPELLKCRERNIEVIKDKTIIRANALNIIHGHEFSVGFFSPVNIARGLFLRAKVTALQGHNHQSSSHTERDLSGKVVKTWSLGCLCELHPDYMPINKWDHGFATVTLDKDGERFHVNNYSIINGEVV